LKFQFENVRQGFDGEGFRQSGDAFHEGVAADEHHEQELVERFALPDDGLTQFASDVLG
jgi:hypothetical protein